ncbi:MAG: hypothetical protein H0V45_13545 [Actinobacteria bacterium]|nr:hypothetical protein [Actinomycetota bacterium]
MTELELRLSSLRAEIAFPETPDLAAAFEGGLAPAQRRPRRLRPLAIALAALAAVAAGVLALSPGARSAFLEIFHLRGATVERVDELPDVPTTGRLALGERVTREEAERRVGFALLDLGEPDAVFVRNDSIATLVYGPVERPRVVLSQLRGSVYEGFVKKVGGAGTRVQDVTVAGERGLFLSGAEHFVMFRDESGRIADEPTYVAGNTLLWNRGPLLLRLEGDFSRATALELARSIE